MSKIIGFIKSRSLWLNILAMCIVGGIVLFSVSTWLKSYTNHGQKITLPDFVGISMESAKELAKENNFQLIVIDSIHIVGKPGAMILNQNPAKGSYVKEERKIYLTITKHSADMINLSKLPMLYGKNYERKRKELKQGYQLNTKIVGKIYDAGPPGHIMKVIIGNDTVITKRDRVKNYSIAKGGLLKVVISKQSGGQVQIPDLKCMSYSEAKFLLSSYKLKLGSSEADASVDNFNSAYVYKQEPEFLLSGAVPMQTAFTLYLTADKPNFCN